MKRRLYFLLPGINSANLTMHDLLLARVNADSIHFLAKQGTIYLKRLSQNDLT